ncbi:MAG: glycosyltransferase, partial [Mucilaginibacter sp.]
VSNKHSDLELHLYGSPSAADFNTLESVISDLGLKDKVFIKGKISNDKVPAVLVNSYVLLSSQPATMRAQGGFPTKLGEYMAVGRPTLLTDVGEISKYITDGENAWLARPNDPDHFAEKLEYIINNYNEAMKVAENGKKYILQNFDYKIQVTRLVAFFTNLLATD